MIKKIILDFETSGLNMYHDDIIEIAMKEMGTDNEFTCLVHPKSNELISSRITQITGITNKMLFLEGLPWEEAYCQASDWLQEITNGEKICIVSHNGEVFDFISLRRMLRDVKQLQERKRKIINPDKIIFIDTLLLAKRLISGRDYYNQNSLCKTLDIELVGCHRAMNDVLALEKLFNELIQKLNAELNKRQNVYEHPQMIHDYLTMKI